MKDKYNPYECYWRREYQDMQATVSTCEYYGKYGYCPCNYDCEHYISEQEIDNILRKISSKQFVSEVEE